MITNILLGWFYASIFLYILTEAGTGNGYINKLLDVNSKVTTIGDILFYLITTPITIFIFIIWGYVVLYEKKILPFLNKRIF